MSGGEPAELPAEGELDTCLAELEAGRAFKGCLESLLLGLEEERAERLMMLLREARGSWLPLLRGRPGRTLFCGNALSGTVLALILTGHRPLLADRRADRLAFARHRAAALTGRRPDAVLSTRERLPFAEGSFDLVIAEGGSPGTSAGLPIPPTEARRVARGEVVMTADNRLGYKRSTGRRGHFTVPGPLHFASAALRPRSGERTLGAYRRALTGGGRGRPAAFALYPHSADFTHLVALDEPWPTLHIGPKERGNRWKTAACALGLFPLLTPSFALASAPRELESASRLARLLDALAELLGTPPLIAQELIATRGNTALIQTAARDDPRAHEGRLTIRIPLGPHLRPMVSEHHERLGAIRREFPAVPVPAPLFAGELEGLWLTCEQRLAGLTAPQVSGRHPLVARMLTDAADHLAQLVTRPASRLDAEGFEELLGWRFELVGRHVAVASTLARLERMRDELRERLVGLSFPRVLSHGDLRSKHVQVRPDGSVLGYLDWGTSRRDDLPGWDLLHLIAHEHKQEHGLRPAEAWERIRRLDRLRDHERAALADHARRLGVGVEVLEAGAEGYPVLLAAMAESHWDYSRPRWVHRQFDL
ncbi:MAG: phosphotransferase [Planctomycetota bacterium]|nr:phosphotransferase [Planctomycetota bacterium]